LCVKGNENAGVENTALENGTENSGLENAGMENSGIKNMASVEGLNERTRKINTAKSFVSLNS